MNIAIRITLFRLFLVPVFLGLILIYRRMAPGTAEWLRYTAFGVLVVAGISDVVDGYIARARGMTTKLGGFLDPLADKLLYGLGIIVVCLPPVQEGFAFERRPALWYPIAVVATNVTLGLGALTAYLLRKKVKIKAVALGKAAAIFQAVTMGWILLKIPMLRLLYYPAGILTIAAGIDYVIGAVRQVRTAEASKE